MTQTIQLSSAVVESDVVRDSPRAPDMRQEGYDAQYDWKTLFYDVYRSGRYVVLQGPPLFNLLGHLRQDKALGRAFRWPFPQAKHIAQDKRGEIWLKTDADRIRIDCPLGSYDLAVQPDDHARYARKRVLLTQSKNNRIEWIADWLRYHHSLHGADAALVYDNNSTHYDCDELQRRLSEAVPAMDVQVVSWPFPFGPQAGPLWAIGGKVPDWDSDFCQVGVLQHARFRFLRDAASVMHNDVDEMVIASGNRTVFEAAEQSPTGMIKFAGRWISTFTDADIAPADVRHADFIYDEGERAELSPAKWCLRPQAFDRRVTWGVHNVFGSGQNDVVTDEFLFRHLRGVSTSWHYDRWKNDSFDRSELVRDEALVAAWQAAGLQPSGTPARAAATA